MFLSETLRGEYIRSQVVDDRYWRVRFAAFPIALFDSRRAYRQDGPFRLQGQAGALGRVGWEGERVCRLVRQSPLNPISHYGN